MERTKPHCDLTRSTPFGAWLTTCRLQAGLRQSDLASFLGSIDPRLGNQGRPNELETGKRRPTAEVVEGLHRFFQERLGQDCPPPPVL